MKNEQIIIIDIDGVLSNPSHRIQHAINKDWDKFNDLMEFDEPNAEMFTILHYFILNFKVVFLTARPEHYRMTTFKWLMANSNNSYLMKTKLQSKEIELIMRPSENKESSEIFKEKILKELKNKFKIILAIDDNSKVVKMFRKHGINTLQQESMYKININKN